jgi:hypothetical protein
MISLSWNSSFEPNSFDGDRHIAALMESYRALPRHIARKHLMASMRKVMRPAVPILKKNTPKAKTRVVFHRQGPAGEYGATKVKGGSLRRAATVRTGQTGKNGAFDSFVYGVLGYKAGFESRKAIWLQFGTSGGVKPFQMIEKTLAQFGPVAASKLADEMAKALEKATAELAGGKNPGYGG